MRTQLSLILILAFLLTSCDLTSSDKPGGSVDKITFHTLFQAFQTDADIDAVETVVLENKNQVDDFLTTYLPALPEQHSLFDVNYTDSLVLGVFVGARSNNSYSIEIDSILVDNDLNQVFVTEAGSAFGGRVIVWPAHFISISKTDFGDRKATINLNQVCELDPCSWQN